MKILLISPASGKWHRIGRRKLFNGRSFRFSMLSLLTVAGLCPEDAEVTIIDEQLDELPVAGPDNVYDIVGITVMTATAPRAYELCSHFSQLGSTVVLGGFHPTLNTEEALRHCDAVVKGCAFGAWEKLIADFKAGRLNKVYEGDPTAPRPSRLPIHLMDSNKYVTVNATYATMGCRNQCRFCSISAFHQAKLYLSDIETIVSEVADFDSRFFIFVDDNLTQDRDFAVELLKRLAPLKKKWITQASVDIADDDELLDLLARAGCVGLFVGLESFNEQVLTDQDKGFNMPDKYAQAIRRIHNHGIFVESGVIFGFDEDRVEVFEKTLKLLDRMGIDAIQVSVLTPLPGTRLYEEMAERIYDHDWSHYDYRHVVFEPGSMGSGELQAGADWVIRKYYSPLRIARRFLRWLRLPGGLVNFAYPLGLNVAYFGRVISFGIKGFNPAATASDGLPNLLADVKRFFKTKTDSVRRLKQA